MVIDTADPKYKKNPYLLAYDRALLLWGVPIEEKDVDTKYGKAHVIVCGPASGEALVLLHGMNASSTMWYPNIKLLAQQYRIYAIDFLLEPGKSMCENDVSEVSQIMDWYEEIFEKLSLKKFSLIGASRGGWLATNIALRNQEKISKMILLSPAQTFVWIKPGAKIINNIVYTISPKRKRLREVLETMSFNVDNIEQEYIDQYYLSTKKAEINKCVMDMKPFSDNELKSIRIPTLLLIGDNDIINDRKSLKRAEKLMPRVETATIKHAGHFLSFDAAPEVNAKILRFLLGERVATAGK
jgi:pimeloyl-ACP methyl ester carboxylesterase